MTAKISESERLRGEGIFRDAEAESLRKKKKEARERQEREAQEQTPPPRRPQPTYIPQQQQPELQRIPMIRYKPHREKDPAPTESRFCPIIPKKLPSLPKMRKP